MTENDKQLIKMAKTTRTNDRYIAELYDRADTDEARVILEELEKQAFVLSERIAFEYYD